MRFTYKVEQDDQGDSPREWDNLGTMVCWHNRYNLGDEQPAGSIGHLLSNMIYALDLEKDTEQFDDFIYDLENDYREAIDKAFSILDNHWYVLPLFLYDHSGITMNTTGFSCPWDSGQVGIVYVTKRQILEEWGRKRMSPKLRDIAMRNLKSEVETYDQYLTGDVWYYTIEDEEGDVVDSCGGFYGYDYCVANAESMVKWQETTTPAKENHLIGSVSP